MGHAKIEDFLTSSWLFSGTRDCSNANLNFRLRSLDSGSQLVTLRQSGQSIFKLKDANVRVIENRPEIIEK